MKVRTILIFRMESLKDDAQLILQGLFQHEINVRLKIDEIKNGVETFPFPLIQKIRSNLNILKIKIKEQPSSEAQDFLQQQHMLHLEELEVLQQQLRNALNVQNEIRDKEEKEALLSGGTIRKRASKDVTKVAEDITNRMQRNTEMLASMVRQQEDTVKNLVTSSSEIKEVDSEYQTLSSVLISSHRLVTKFGRRAMTDTILTYLGFFLFLCTVLYVIQKRIFS